MFDSYDKSKKPIRVIVLHCFASFAKKVHIYLKIGVYVIFF